MKVLCVIDSLGSGGAQRQLVELAKGFKEKGYTVSFLVYHEENFFKGDLDEINIPVTSIIESNYLRRLFKIRSYIRKGNYDVVLSFLEAASFICEFAALPRKNWKLIIGERSANPSILKSFKHRFYRWFHLFADHVVANSHANLAMVQQVNPLLSSSKCHVIYNLVNFNYWKPATDYNPFLEQKLSIVVAASHQYLKNAKGLIEAINYLNAEERNKIKVTWYGDESPDNSYKEAELLVKKYKLQNVLFFKKATNNIREKLQQADVVGLFSLFEGLPNVICESMSMGKPVISSAVSDISMILNHDTRCLFDSKEVKEITKTLSYILTLNSEELCNLGEFNRLKACNLFDKNKVISSYISLFKK